MEQNKPNSDAKMKRFMLTLRRALKMVIRAIEEMYPEEFPKQ